MLEEKQQEDKNKENDLEMALIENGALRKKAEEHQKTIRQLRENSGNDTENSTMEYVTTSVDEIVSN